ncbi:hypothetical protein D7Z26_03420 [Cohnella endophytica]|uniref:Uncharacterized protein n=2 Tax=Cohnella endophytica TaxID=2419778 RepID=A0A494Y307_9BACL|nr:hypothetical protein D7Z26_03420 [Cohnella endophytica]
MRLEQLNKQGEGERKLLADIIWPVRGSFEGIELEKEFYTLTGVKAYIDAFDERVSFGLESEGFVPHAENITRPRFDFEKVRIRSMGALGILFIPFSFDEMDKKPDLCRRNLYEMYGKFGGGAETLLSPSEKEILRHMHVLGRPIRMRDAEMCLAASHDYCLGVLRGLVIKNYIRPSREGAIRVHTYELVDNNSSLRSR